MKEYLGLAVRCVNFSSKAFDDWHTKGRETKLLYDEVSLENLLL